MSEAFIGEIRPFAFNFAPRNWALCNGQLLNIAQNTALFSLLGTMYGGNGTTNFGLPDLRGRTPLHIGNGFNQGQQSGEEIHTLISNEIPMHTHQAVASSGPANTSAPSNTGLIAAAQGDIYAPAASLTTMHSGSLSSVGSSQPHNNMQPYLVINFCIALVGIFPSRN